MDFPDAKIICTILLTLWQWEANALFNGNGEYNIVFYGLMVQILEALEAYRVHFYFSDL